MSITIKDIKIISKIIDYKYVLNNLHKPWNWFILSLRSDFDFQLLEANYERLKPYICWQWLSCNRSLPLNFLLKHKDWNWDWDYINLNPVISLEFVKNYPDLPWDKELLCSNPTIAIEILEIARKKFNIEI